MVRSRLSARGVMAHFSGGDRCQCSRMSAVWVLGYRGLLSVVAVSLAVLSIAVFSEKSFAPQYLMWLAPFWAYWPIRRGWVVAALLTTSCSLCSTVEA